MQRRCRRLLLWLLDTHFISTCIVAKAVHVHGCNTAAPRSLFCFSSTISSLLSRSFLFSNHVFISFCHFLSFSVFNVSRMFKCFVCTFVASYFPHCALCVHCVQCVGYTFAEPTDADGNMLSLCFENVMPSFLLMFLFLPITFCSYSPQLCLSYRFSVHFLLLTAYVIIDF